MFVGDSRDDYDDEDDGSDYDDNDSNSERIDISPHKLNDSKSDDDELDGFEAYDDTEAHGVQTSLSTKANLFLATSKNIVKQRVSDLGTKVPLVNQSFARVHVGFWEAYSSIREDYMRAVVKSIYLHRREFIEKSRTFVSGSPSAFFNSDGLSGEEESSTLRNKRQQLFSNLNSILGTVYVMLYDITL